MGCEASLPALRGRDAPAERPFPAQRRREPGVPTKAKMMQVWLICPRGTNSGPRGSGGWV